MNSRIYSVIKGTGSYIPCINVPNIDFLKSKFFDSSGNIIPAPNEEIIEKFKAITGIKERRYLDDEYVTSDLATMAAKSAIDSTGINKEEIDYIIVAHNFGDIPKGNIRTDMLPSLAARVKNNLEIKNPYTIAYDIIFGCPGWLQGMIQADYYIRTGDAKRVMVIGAEVLSRISDPHDRDSMIYSDGAGATIIEAQESNEPVGMISKSTRSDTLKHSRLMWLGPSYNPDYDTDEMFVKMNGRKIYEYAISTVPVLVKDLIDKTGLQLKDIKKILLHQANAKLDVEIVNRIFKLYGEGKPGSEVLPMTIYEFGNNSVATIPILADLIFKGELNGHNLDSGDYALFASVGAGMNINAFIYRLP
jgi:3-oxoacyl-[acyl-carrier-protein] synthase-3